MTIYIIAGIIVAICITAIILGLIVLKEAKKDRSVKMTEEDEELVRQFRQRRR